MPALSVIDPVLDEGLHLAAVAGRLRAAPCPIDRDPVRRTFLVDADRAFRRLPGRGRP